MLQPLSMPYTDLEIPTTSADVACWNSFSTRTYPSFNSQMSENSSNVNCDGLSQSTLGMQLYPVQTMAPSEAMLSGDTSTSTRNLTRTWIHMMTPTWHCNRPQRTSCLSTIPMHLRMTDKSGGRPSCHQLVARRSYKKSRVRMCQREEPGLHSSIERAASRSSWIMTSRKTR
jgi:hypothetical protein